jgi:hypothetical protein
MKSPTANAVGLFIYFAPFILLSAFFSTAFYSFLTPFFLFKLSVPSKAPAAIIPHAVRNI